MKINIGDQYDDDGVHQHKVYSLEFWRWRGQWCRTKIGAVMAFLFHRKHD